MKLVSTEGFLNILYSTTICLSPILNIWFFKSIKGDLDSYATLLKHIYTKLSLGGKCPAAKSLQSCPTLCDPIDSSPPGSPIPGILQARTLECAALAFSNAWKWKVKVKPLSRVQPSVTPWTAAYQAPPSMGFSRQEYWSGVPLCLRYLKWFLPSLVSTSLSDGAIVFAQEVLK